MLIYVITNRINGKQYVGQTIHELLARWAMHLWCARNGYRWPIYAAIRKYGVQSFEIQIIDTASSTQELDEKEMYWIARLGTLAPNGYNIARGGNKGPVLRGADHPYYGKPRPAEVCAKIAATLKGHAVTPEQIEKYRATRTRNGKRLSPEARAKIGAFHKGKKLSPEQGAKISAAKTGVKRPNMTGDKHPMFGKPGPWTGRHHTAETKAKVSTLLKKRYAEIPPSPERIAKQKATRRQTMAERGGFDQRCIDAMRRSNLGRKKSPEEVEKGAAKRRGQQRTPEQRERMRAAALARWHSNVIQ